MPLVFTQNEVNLSEHAYADVLGETYEYPSQYRNLIQPGEQFVYYRGRRRASGRSATPSYLGVGIVSDVSAIGDRFRCSIANFQPFTPPLPFQNQRRLFGTGGQCTDRGRLLFPNRSSPPRSERIRHHLCARPRDGTNPRGRPRNRR